VLPVLESGQAVLLDGTHAINDELLVEPAPGHTPGHVVLHLRSGGEAALLCGDVVHHPIQVYAPHWNTQFCQDPEQARATRRRVLKYCAEHRALLCPSHFGAPHAAQIACDGPGYALEFVPPVLP
jgi:glyoxylase-like metal-dependent hydrolase (beta-lactamase superfamily II)